MPTYQVEMWWTCNSCKSDNRGRYKQCQVCGKAKEGEVFFDKEDLGPEAAVTDPELLKQALAGSDFECKFCGSHNRRDNGDCSECGALQGESRNTITKWDNGEVGPAGSGMNALEEAKSLSKEFVSQPTKPMPVKKRVLAQSKEPVVEPEESIKIPLDFNHVKITAIVLLVAAILGIGGYFLFRTRIIDAQVDSVSWVHFVNVERYQKVSDAGFDDQIPGDAVDVVPMGERHHHYVKEFSHVETYSCDKPCGEDCHTTPKHCNTTPKHCTSNKNGFKTCSGGDRVCSGGDRVCKTKYCSTTCKRDIYKDVSVKRPYFQWRVWRWKHDRTVTETGNDNNPVWPSTEKVNLQDKERTNQSVDYRVWFIDQDGDKHSYTPDSEAEFRALVPGTKKKIKVRLIGENEIVK